MTRSANLARVAQSLGGITDVLLVGDRRCDPDAGGPSCWSQAVDVGDDGIDLRAGKGKLGHLVVRRGDPARQRLA